MVTNLLGGWLGARWGLNRTMHVGLGLQVLALSLLLVSPDWLSVTWVMFAQALSGIAKDLNKMSAKSAIKQLVPDQAQGQLYRWIALLTGSKNALKGAGYFLGGVLLASCGFRGAVGLMTLALASVGAFSLYLLTQPLGRARSKPKLRHLFSSSPAVNQLAAARVCLFGARDVWFVIALPVYLASMLGSSHAEVGGMLAVWIMFYGAVQALGPRLTGTQTAHPFFWSLPLLGCTLLLSAAISWLDTSAPILITGVFLFGACFALMSALHSYLIVQLSRADGTSLDVGFYYMANAGGRLLGTLLSGLIFQLWGLAACLWVASLLVAATCLLSRRQTL